MSAVVINSVVISGGTHGNEANGVQLAKHLMRHPELCKRPSFETRVILTNTASIKANARYVDEDLNRCFEQRLLDDETRCSVEAMRARELNAELGPKGSTTPACDLIIDLHNTTAATGVALLTASADPVCSAISARLVAIDPSVRICFWKDKPRSEYPLLPSIAPHGMTFEVGAAPWGCLAPALYAQSLELLGRALDYIHEHNLAVAANGPWVQVTVPVYRGLGNRAYPRHADGEMAAMIHPSLQGRDFCLLRVGDPVFQTHSLETITFGSERDPTPLPPDAEKTTFYPFFINEAAYYEVDVAFTLGVREELSLRVVPYCNDTTGAVAKKQKC
mmetsp:Transcript_8279/g.18163  ORF Transcript_8279/g.18163 Transcript_8279/m.18163 type:complete len:333 (-) Transcript_8279:569-1567(-)